MNYSIDSIRDSLKEKLNAKRFTHVLGVTYVCASLAMKYDVSIEKAMLAGILHDAGKAYKREESVGLCEKWGIEMTSVERSCPELLHAKTSAYIAQNEYGIEDEDVLNAILYHTTGRPNMTLLEKIVYIADYIEPSRPELPRIKEIRKFAFEDIDIALYMIFENSVTHLKSSDFIVDPRTEESYKFYKEVINGRN